MDVAAILEFVALLLVLLIVTKPVGLYLARVFTGERTPLSPVLRPVETSIYRLCGVNASVEAGWTGYAVSVLAFGLASTLGLYLLQRLQGMLPLNPLGLSSVPPDLAFGTAASFVAGATWGRSAGAESTSALIQLAGLAVQDFAVAATGLAVAITLVRGIARHTTTTVGNFWVDLVRGTLYVFLPLALVFALAFASQGVPRGLDPGGALVGAARTTLTGPIASWAAIESLGAIGRPADTGLVFSRGGPTPLVGFLEAFAALTVPAGLLYAFGWLVGDTRQGWALWAATAGLLAAGLGAGSLAESAGGPLLSARFGQIAFGGVGIGLQGLLVFAVLAVVAFGLAAGRAPEYLGKRIVPFDLRMALLAVFAVAAASLALAALVGDARSIGIAPDAPLVGPALGLASLAGRFLTIVPVLALAGSLAAKERGSASAKAVPTSGPAFVLLLVGGIALGGLVTQLLASALGLP